MYHKIDWISFSFKRETSKGESPSAALTAVVNGLNALLGADAEILMTGEDWTLGAGRKPYEASYTHPKGGVVLFWHTRLDHALIEITGRGCDWIEETGNLVRLLSTVAHRVTRLDVATDIHTPLDPRLFADARSHGRFRSHSEHVSESGTTFYVGSRDSNRYARVYRYNEPHPRAHLLRIEHVVKAEDAKRTARYLVENGLQSTVGRMAEGFGWSHPAWRMDAPEGPVLEVYRPERKEGKTVYWLNDTVAPLLLRLEREGVLNLDEWISEQLTPHRKPR